VALCELEHIERTQFILNWLQSVELHRRVHAGLNYGEARNALACASVKGWTVCSWTKCIFSYGERPKHRKTTVHRSQQIRIVR
jgi:hypothetical protein